MFKIKTDTARLKADSVARSVPVIAMALLIVALAPHEANAAGVFKTVLCNAVSLITGEVGGVIATLAVLTLGFMALIGRVQWSLVIIVVCGIGVVFGAEALVNYVAPEDFECEAPPA
jgi:type IV secretion system protein VirB2